MIHGKIPNYLDEILERHSTPVYESHRITLGCDTHPVLGTLEDMVAENGDSDFLFTLVGGVRISNTSHFLLPKLWKDAIGDTRMPLKYEARRDAFPDVFSELGGRIDYHRLILEEGKAQSKDR